MVNASQLSEWAKNGARQELASQLVSRKGQIREIFKYRTSRKETRDEIEKVELILSEIKLILAELEKYEA